MGVDFASTDDPSASTYFSSPTWNWQEQPPLCPHSRQVQSLLRGRAQRRFLRHRQIWVYLTGRPVKQYISSATMPHVASSGWRTAAGATVAASPPAPKHRPDRKRQAEQCLQRHCHRPLQPGRQLRPDPSPHFDSAKPNSADGLKSEDVPIKSGPGLKCPCQGPAGIQKPGHLQRRTIEITLTDDKSKVLTTVKTKSTMNWASRRDEPPGQGRVRTAF